MRILWCCVDQFWVATQLATPLGKKKRNTMSTDPKDGSDLNPNNIIAVTLEDLPEDERQKLEQELEEERVEKLKQKLAGFQRTRNGVI